MGTSASLEALRALDGLALVAVAFRLGLAGPLVHAVPSIQQYWYKGTTRRWNPAENLAQAEAVFRRVRLLGWWSEVQGCAADGWCRASGDDNMELAVCWPSDGAPTESHALLLCAVLAATVSRTTEPSEKETLHG